MPERLINISIRIADHPRIPLRIPQSQEEAARRAEANINELWSKWSGMDEFRDKSSGEILAMVTFRFAQLYYSNLEAAQNIDSVLANLEQKLDGFLLQGLPELTPPAADKAEESAPRSAGRRP